MPPRARHRASISRRTVLQEILGHASISTTLDLYRHLDPADMDKYTNRLDQAARDVGTAKIRPDDDEDDPENLWPGRLAAGT
jgi:hypothetical protein